MFLTEPTELWKMRHTNHLGLQSFGFEESCDNVLVPEAKQENMRIFHFKHFDFTEET
jgi:hypothetical protein